jgi:Tol biopolymer transport system component
MVDVNPEFSPDGPKMAFVSDRGGETSDIWVANADGSEPVRVTHENGLASTARWSPDGRFIVFDLYTPDGAAMGDMNSAFLSRWRQRGACFRCSTVPSNRD